jgi:hypothetical protein
MAAKAVDGATIKSHCAAALTSIKRASHFASLEHRPPPLRDGCGAMEQPAGPRAPAPA